MVFIMAKNLRDCQTYEDFREYKIEQFNNEIAPVLNSIANIIEFKWTYTYKNEETFKKDCLESSYNYAPKEILNINEHAINISGNSMYAILNDVIKVLVLDVLVKNTNLKVTKKQVEELTKYFIK